MCVCALKVFRAGVNGSVVIHKTRNYLGFGDSEKVSFFKGFIYLFFRERVREGEREGEKHQCVVAPQKPPTGDLPCNPGMYPDWELNQRPFGL